jgi:periplasmic divalent cation tolerance protein
MISILYIPFPNEEIATSVVRHLLEHQLIACANIYVSKSHYFWQGILNVEDEWVAIIKTTMVAADTVEKTIVGLHPYEIPAIIQSTAKVNESYLSWVEAQVVLK